MEQYYLILGAGIVIILSYAFNMISDRTNVPSVLMLMLLGIGANIFYPVESESIMPSLEVLGIAGVILIVLEASLDLHLTKENFSILWKSAVLSLILLLLTAFFIATFVFVLLGLDDFLKALFYATPLAVMSSAIIIPSVQKLRKVKKEFLIFESAFSDIFGIVFFFLLLDVAKGETDGILGICIDAIGNITLTIAIGMAINYVLIIVFHSLHSHVRISLLIAIIMALYAAGKLIHLSALLPVLIFGLMLNNKDVFFRGQWLKQWVNDDDFAGILRDFRMLTLEASFIVRTFFFVAFGMSVVLSDLFHPMVFIISIIALFGIYGLRFVGLRTFLGRDYLPELLIAPRGLITVLLFYSIPEYMQTEAFKPGILLFTILVSSGVMTYGLIRYKEPAEPDTTHTHTSTEPSSPPVVPPSNNTPPPPPPPTPPTPPVVPPTPPIVPPPPTS